MTAQAPFTPKPFNAPTAEVQHCPIQASLGALGRKWALLVLRDVAFFDRPRFSDMLRASKGLTPRVLSMRLQELQREGFIRRVTRPEDGLVYYELTEKGQDTMPILAALSAFGIKHHANVVFRDGRPRTLGELLPGAQGPLLGHLRDYASEARAPRRPGGKARP